VVLIKASHTYAYINERLYRTNTSHDKNSFSNVVYKKKEQQQRKTQRKTHLIFSPQISLSLSLS
jgi:hypothetical protein